MDEQFGTHGVPTGAMSKHGWNTSALIRCRVTHLRRNSISPYMLRKQCNNCYCNKENEDAAKLIRVKSPFLCFFPPIFSRAAVAVVASAGYVRPADAKDAFRGGFPPDCFKFLPCKSPEQRCAAPSRTPHGGRFAFWEKPGFAVGFNCFRNVCCLLIAMLSI